MTTTARKRRTAVRASKRNVWCSAHEYNEFLTQLNRDFQSTALASVVRIPFEGSVHTPSPAFLTDASHVWEAFLSGFPSGKVRNYYDCNLCRHFVERYGGLVFIEPNGSIKPTIWSMTPSSPYAAAVKAARGRVLLSRVTGVFYDDSPVWGTPSTGDWHHMHVNPPTFLTCNLRPPTAARERMIAKWEDARILTGALNEFPKELVAQAISQLGPAAQSMDSVLWRTLKWFYGVHCAVDDKVGKQRENLVHLHSALAPNGLCQTYQTSVVPFLAKIARSRLEPKMFSQSLQGTTEFSYRIPPKTSSNNNPDGIIRSSRAERLQLALRRRFARLNDLTPIWSPQIGNPRDFTASNRTVRTSGAVVSGLCPMTGQNLSSASRFSTPSQEITWVDFARLILPRAESIQFSVLSYASYVGLTTVLNPNASPPILQWDFPSSRNPVAWYTYQGDSPASQWNLVPNSWANVTAITLLPPLWNTISRQLKEDDKRVIFILGGAVDSNTVGHSLFHEYLKPEFSSISDEIIAKSSLDKLAERDRASACGIGLGFGNIWKGVCRVKLRNRSDMVTYHISEWG